MDEHRLGLKPILGKVWAPRGERPIVRVQHRYEWLYLAALACPETGSSQYWLLPEVNVTAFQLVLDAFARSAGAGPDKHIVLVLDGAGWHTSGTLQVPEGLELVFLPPYSPELQPAERLWALTDVQLKNKHFASLSDLQTTLAATCQTLEACPDQVRAHTLFHWWPRHSSVRN
jgi:transposase